MSKYTVPIAPGSSILAVLKHLNYKEWYALAEFVDNAVQSFLSNRNSLAQAGSTKLTVCVDIDDDGNLKVRDNAAGIALADFPRAFRPAQVPPDASGLSEFGMGMKSAACWFAPRWSVRTKALGDPFERTVTFDVAKIVADDLDELEVQEREVAPQSHYTEVVLEGVRNVLRTRTLGKVREHLQDIYRQFLREGWLTLEVKGESLRYEEPAALVVSPDWSPNDPPVEWRKEFDLDLGGGQRATGFAALFSKGSTRRAGFALFRRKRLIQGSADDGYKPDRLFGSANSYRRQRLFGEITLTGFDVSHTKDGFRWEQDEEEAFLELLRQELDAEPLPLLKQAEAYRANRPAIEIRDIAKAAAADTASDVAKSLAATVESSTAEDEGDVYQGDLPSGPLLADEIVEVRCDGVLWQVHIQPSADAAQQAWIELVDQHRDQGVHVLKVRVSSSHPFTVRFADDDERPWQALMRMAAAIAIGQALARQADPANRVGASAMLRNINNALREMTRWH